jgi:hypothetical protein
VVNQFEIAGVVDSIRLAAARSVNALMTAAIGRSAGVSSNLNRAVMAGPPTGKR